MAKEEIAAWTIMVYLAGDNNLTTECMFALTEMKGAALSNKNFNVIAQFDPSDPYLPSHRYKIDPANKSIYDDIFDCARYYKNKDEVKFKKESDKAIELATRREQALAKVRKAGLKKLKKASLTATKSSKLPTDDTDTGSPITLYNFISYCLQNYPARRYMVVLSGHAGGTERDYLLKDESSARSLTFNELKQVFKQIRRDRHGDLIDIIGMDNCLMSMAEICYELRDVAEVVVGCESFSPISGWPYRQILERLYNEFGDPKLPAGKSVTVEAAKAIVDEYVNFYATYWMAGLSVTQSALDVAKVEELQRHINSLAQAMEKELVAESKNESLHPAKRIIENALLLAHWEAQSYNGEQYVDVYDFCDCLEKRVQSEGIAKRCQTLKDFIRDEFVLRSCYCGGIYQYSYGVSIYFPWAEIAPSYWNLDFVDQKTPGWGSFLQAYTRLTRRAPRNGIANHRMMYNRGNQGYAAGGDRMVFNRMLYDRMLYDRMGSASNRIHSMRNPPVAFNPDPGVKDSGDIVKSQKMFRVR
jgi:hypothetical protein